MDRVARSTASKVNSASKSNDPNGPRLPENSSGSILTRASTVVGNLMARALLPAPQFPTTPKIYKAPGNVLREPSSGTICTDDTLHESLINDYVSNETLNNTKIECLPNGDFKLHLPVITNDAQLFEYLVFQCQGYDFSKATELNLSFCTNLTGQTLQLLSKKLPSLRTLDLTGCNQFNDADLVHVAHMANLDNLCLAGCSGFSKQGFEYMTSLLDKLETLDLTGCPQLDDDFLSLLPNMLELKSLVLSGCTGFTGEGLGKIGKEGALGKLQTLTLDQCRQISDSDLGRLRNLSQLKQLDIRNCPSITQNGINKLRRHLKSTKVESDLTPTQEPRPKKTRLSKS